MQSAVIPELFWYMSELKGVYVSCSSVHLGDSEHPSLCSYTADHSIKTHIWVHGNIHK